MIETEFIKSMDLNFERTMLAEKPEERRYQYCIVSRGGIGGLLGCSLRFINGDAFLYYDITSKQSLAQIMFKKKIDREWLKDFAWNLNHIKQEMSRFLLDDKNVIWFPEQVYRDLDENKWSFMYYPYFAADNGFKRFLEFVIEKLDYEDEKLVECAYKIYEQYEEHGDAYLKEKIFEDIRGLDKLKPFKEKEKIAAVNESQKTVEEESDSPEEKEEIAMEEIAPVRAAKEPKKGLFSFLESARRKDREAREKIRKENMYSMEIGTSAVAEDDENYGEAAQEDEMEDGTEEEYGRTVYIENVAEAKEESHRLYDSTGAVLSVLGESSLVIGKKKDEADIILDNSTISRIHARIVYEKGEYYLEDLNSTNGTFKNGLRLRPYERRRMAEGDEIRLGSFKMMYK